MKFDTDIYDHLRISHNFGDQHVHEHVSMLTCVAQPSFK